MSRSHSAPEFKEFVENKIRDLEIQRDVIKGKVDMIHGLRAFQLVRALSFPLSCSLPTLPFSS
jgi:hypothetical protein